MLQVLTYYWGKGGDTEYLHSPEETRETEVYKIIKECEKLSEEKAIDQTTYEGSLD